MLKGGMEIVENHANVKHKTAAFHFSDQPILLFVDSMRWTKVLFEPLTDNIPDALKTNISLEYLQKSLLRKRGIPIKGFLIDQKILKGIGNAYADEILYECKISPESFCEKLPPDAIVKLKEKIPETLQWGVNEIRKILPNTINGEERSFLKVHNKEKSKTASGFPILVKEIAGKTTYFTEEQILYV
jgi:formamidopyrimidine-DNA glycosylase